jgi:uncharacterized membrane protein HdeD (DUF308 family)
MMHTLAAVTKKATTWSLVWSVVLIVFGVLAIALPLASSIGVVLLLGWLVLFDGGAQVIHAFQSSGVGHIIWKLLVALFYLIAGFYLISHPLAGVAVLTLVLAIFLFAEGIADIIAYFSLRKQGGSGWMLVNGLITLLLGVLIWRHWPGASLGIMGTLLGISMIMTGVARLMMALAVRRLVTAVA